MSDVKSDISRIQNDLRLVRSFQAEHTAAIDEIRAEIRALTGKIEEVEYSQKERFGREMTNLERNVSSLQQRIPPPEIVPVGALEADEAMLQSVQGEASRLLADALSSIRQGRFDTALTFLRNALAERDGEALAPNVIFWMGIAHEGSGQTAEALRSYHQVAKEFPNHRRAPLALLRQANTLTRMGDTASAKLTLKKLTLEFPKTEEAAAAAQRLKTM